ncbi:MAG: orotate phosphoribosyltransferase [Actinomycetota bacterium]
MTESEVLEELERVGAVSNGHFLLSSGRHSDRYVEKFRALEDPGLAMRLGEAIAERFRDRRVEVVLSPAVGALLLGFATASAIGARFVFCEREDGEMRLRRGFRIREGEAVLVVEDVVTTGASVSEVVRLVPPESLAGVGALVDRSEGASDVAFTALVRLEASSWAPEDCPLCARGAPLEAPGSRHLAGT